MLSIAFAGETRKQVRTINADHDATVFAYNSVDHSVCLDCTALRIMEKQMLYALVVNVGARTN